MELGIYIITNTTNGKVYIGSSKSLRRRWEQHRRRLRNGEHNNQHLKHAWEQCGAESFHFAILEYCDPKDLMDRESWWMELLCSRESAHGYNIWDAHRHEMSEETRAKLRARVCSDETRAKLSAAAKTISEEVREKRRARATIIPEMMAKGHSPEARSKAAASNTGKKRTDETKAKIGAANSGKSPSTETRAKLAEAKRKAAAEGRHNATGHKLSKERKREHSERIKRLHAEGRYKSQKAAESISRPAAG